jgi:hypothetical protein
MSMTIEHAGMARIRFCDVETRLSMSETTMPLAASLPTVMVIAMQE